MTTTQTSNLDFSTRLNFVLLLDPAAEADDPNGAFVSCGYNNQVRFKRTNYTSWQDLVTVAHQLTDEVADLNNNATQPRNLTEVDISKSTETKENFQKAIPDKDFNKYYSFAIGLDPNLSGTGDKTGAIIVVTQNDQSRFTSIPYTDWTDIVVELQRLATQVHTLNSRPAKLPQIPAVKPAPIPASSAKTKGKTAEPVKPVETFKSPFTLEQKGKQRIMDMMFDPFDLTDKYRKNKQYSFETLDEAIEVAKILAEADNLPTLVKDKSKKTAFDSSKPTEEITDEAVTAGPEEIPNEDDNEPSDPDDDNTDPSDPDDDDDSSDDNDDDDDNLGNDETDYTPMPEEEELEEVPSNENSEKLHIEQTVYVGIVPPFTLWVDDHQLVMSVDHPFDLLTQSPNKRYEFDDMDAAESFAKALSTAIQQDICIRDANEHEMGMSYAQAS